MEIGENKGGHVGKVSTYKPQLLLLSSIQENPNSSIDSEIGVFGAEKYFNMKLDHQNISTLNTTIKPIKKQYKDNNHQQQNNPTFTKTTSSKSKSSVKSESSYNSQTFLMKINNDTKQRKTNDFTFSFRGFKCNGPCSGGKSVNTNRKVNEKSTKSNQDYVSYDARKHLAELKKQDSLQANNIKRSDIAINLERKLSMLTWDAIPNAQNAANHLSNKKHNSCSSKMMQEDEETGSDTSSDLFEIENIITNNSSVYEPSEASIGWSVVTDQSMVSDFDVKRVSRLRNNNNNNKPAVKTVNGEKNRLSSGGFLNGCKSNKAVLIVDTTKRSNVMKEEEEEEKQVMSNQKKFRRIQDLSFL